MRRRQMIQAGAEKSAPPPIDPVEAYIAKFGKPPHHRMKLETILERLRNDTCEQRA